ncbi:MAG: DoxX family protein [Terracidiphilus sp.]
MTEKQITALEPLHRLAAAWSFARPTAFRFCFVYFILFALSNQIVNSIFIVPRVDVPDWATLWPFRLGNIWIAHRVFGVKAELVYQGSGSGDKTFDWVLVFCLLVIALVSTAVWSVFDRKRTSYPVLSKWFFLFLRVALASQMFAYGSAKAFPLQMPFPYLFRLIEPFRNFSPMGVLWTSVGASPGYEVFTGCAELAAGFLLIFPRSATLGALLAMADMIQVFVLNMTYDVPVKLLSFQLIVMSLVLLAPNIGQLLKFFFGSKPAALAAPEPLFHSARANRIASVVLAAIWLWMIGNNIYSDWDSWHKYGSGRTKSALYGIWNVEQLAVDGQNQPLDVNNKDEWRRVVFDFPTIAQVQLMDDEIGRFTASLDANKKTLTLTKRNDKKWQASFSFDRAGADGLILDGLANGHKQHIELKLMDSAQFPLTSRGFHWVQEYPFNY